MAQRELTANGMSPFSIEKADAPYPALIVCEHASNHIPGEFGDLGLSPADLESHIAWDPGAAGVATHLSNLLNAPCILGGVSRLLYDCNRPPDAHDAIPATSGGIAIPGNRGLDAAARAQRISKIHEPFRHCIAEAITKAGGLHAIVTVHSFTPVYLGVHRDVELGILHDEDTRLADAVLAAIASHTSLNVQRNQPYGPKDGVTHTLVEHGIANGLLNVMIEIRSDLIKTADEQKAIAGLLHDVLAETLESLAAGDRKTELAG